MNTRFTVPQTALRTNRLLASLPPAVWEQVRADLKCVELRQGAVLHDAGEVLQHVYFPVTAVVSLVLTLADGASAEIAVVGHEGVVGVCAFIGSERTHSTAVVQGAGLAWRMPVSTIAAHAARSGPMRLALLRSTQTLIEQMARNGACYRHHKLEQQLCRWLLQQVDRSNSAELSATHERIAAMLGVRREGVTAGALSLQQAGLIRYARGRIAILDRAGLQARTCECYTPLAASDACPHGAQALARRVGPRSSTAALDPGVHLLVQDLQRQRA